MLSCEIHNIHVILFLGNTEINTSGQTEYAELFFYAYDINKIHNIKAVLKNAASHNSVINCSILLTTDITELIYFLINSLKETKCF